MKESDFELLIASVKEAGQIRRGEIEPPRKFAVNDENLKNSRPRMNRASVA